MNKLNKEKLLFIFILLNPLFDLISSLFNHLNFANTPSTFIRPLIPLVLIIYIFITDKSIRKKLIIISSIYIIYILVHTLIYKNIITGISYGSVFHEIEYLLNYTYLIFNLLLYGYLFYGNKKDTLKNAVFYNTIFYVSTIYIAILSNSSITSYVEGIGYKGWFNASGAVGAILIISLFIILPYLLKKEIKFIYKALLIVSIIFYLFFLIGSRAGLYGSIILILSFVIASLFDYFINKKRDNKEILSLMLVLAVALTIGYLLFGSNTTERRQELDDMKDDKSHIAYDLEDIKENVDNNLVDTKYMNKEQIKALNSLYDYANDTNLSNIDLRKQQLIYNVYLYKYQHNVLYKLFGNGYLVNFSSLTLEMEEIALFINFGIIGFILYFVPFLSIFIYGAYIGIKYIKRLDSEYIMYMAGIFTSYFIALFSGHIYFNTSVMPVVIIIHILLLNKIKVIKEEI